MSDGDVSADRHNDEPVPRPEVTAARASEGIEQPEPARPDEQTLAARVGLLLVARERLRAAGRAPDRYAVVIDEASALLADRPRAGDHAALLRRCIAAGRGPGLPPRPGGRRSGTEG